MYIGIPRAYDGAGTDHVYVIHQNYNIIRKRNALVIFAHLFHAFSTVQLNVYFFSVYIPPIPISCDTKYKKKAYRCIHNCVLWQFADEWRFTTKGFEW